MVLDFELQTYLNNLPSTKPPYVCPHPDCGKSYKSYTGIVYHVHQHGTPDGDTPGHHRRKKRGRGAAPMLQLDSFQTPQAPEKQLTFAESHSTLEVRHNGGVFRLSIYDNIAIQSGESEEETVPQPNGDVSLDGKPATPAGLLNNLAPGTPLSAPGTPLRAGTPKPRGKRGGWRGKKTAKSKAKDQPPPPKLHEA